MTTVNETTSYGKAEARAWDRLHPRLTHRAAWLDHQGMLPIVEGTLIRLQVEHLPGDRDAQPMWLWWSPLGTTGTPRAAHPSPSPARVSEPAPGIGSTSGSTETFTPRPRTTAGIENHSRATRYDVGKTVKRETSLGGPPRRKPKARG
ncbi:hypothetical protein Asi03nite_68470 [Actinoplanes siamensis]|uniref:Uncharacterized protein n=1 Tax=Actinoplanes siamensis TaxID=1223317 RepID=A0A919TNZ4_9ACTN|nr:hypothetical protein Asi03nite_68470 [Actinoplanes siamensis]